MRRSKLELYQDLICGLAEKAQTADELAFECSTNCVLLQARIEFLERHDIVSVEIGADDKAYYVLTRRGLAISKTMSITKQLEKLKTQPQLSAKSMAVYSQNRRKKSKPGW
jgi:predicted transcriptional regulator